MANQKQQYRDWETTPNVEDWSKDVESTAKALGGVQKENADKFVNDFVCSFLQRGVIWNGDN